MISSTSDAPLVQQFGASALSQAVRQRYDAVAADPTGSYNFRVGREFAEALGYPPDLLDRLPAGSVARFTGVAAPVFAAALQAGERILDLGCGSGVDSAVAATAVGPTGRVVAIDFAAGMVRQTAATVAALSLANTMVCQASADAIPLSDHSMDVVVVNGLFNLTPKKRQVLAEVARVLRPGGRLMAAETILTQPLAADELTSLDDWFR